MRRAAVSRPKSWRSTPAAYRRSCRPGAGPPGPPCYDLSPSRQGPRTLDQPPRPKVARPARNAMTTSAPAAPRIAPPQVHELLGRHMLVDGYRLVMDLE